jgi:tRNA threonylcarbamoyladenosine biosynthesis protein TsaE
MAASHASFEYQLPDEAATIRLGEAFAVSIQTESERIERDGLSLGLYGDLGAGKTTFVRSALRKLGISGPVRSPTFSLLELYPLSRLNFYHFDFYRFSDPTEFEALGFRDHFGAGCVCAIEWPDKVSDRELPLDLRLRLQFAGDGRLAQFDATTAVGERCLALIDKTWRGNLTAR